MDGELFQFVEMGGSKRLDSVHPGIGELQPHHPLIVAVAYPADETRRIGAFDQAAGTVMSQQEVVGHLADGWSTWIGMPANGQQQLMLHRSQPRGLGSFGAPPLEAAQIRAQCQQSRVNLIGESHRGHDMPRDGLGSRDD